MALTDPTQENVDKLLKERLRLQDDYRRAIVILRAVEWIEENGVMVCPYCHRQAPEHSPYCVLKNEINESMKR